MSAILEQITANLSDVRGRMAEACARAGRTAAGVTLIAVTKYAQAEWIRTLVELGVRNLGESRPQQLAARTEELGGGAVRWHLIGHLQRNKARRVLPLVERIHSVDSGRLLTFLDGLAGELALRPRVLLEVNVSGEAAKDGFDPDELRRQWPALASLEHVIIDGLMTMAPLSDDAEVSRPMFRRLRALRDELAAGTSGRLPLPELSMGMSGDYEVAIEEGATLVRIGSRLFEGLVGEE